MATLALLVFATAIAVPCDKPRSFSEFEAVLNRTLVENGILSNLDNVAFFVVERWKCGFQLVLHPSVGSPNSAIYVSWDGASEEAKVRRPQ
jgi:hypothetical protein